MAQMLELASQGRRRFRTGLAGTVRTVLWEPQRPGGTGAQWSGLTDNYVRVRTKCERNMGNRITMAQLTEPDGDVLLCTWPPDRQSEARRSLRSGSSLDIHRSEEPHFPSPFQVAGPDVVAVGEYQQPTLAFRLAEQVLLLGQGNLRRASNAEIATRLRWCAVGTMSPR